VQPEQALHPAQQRLLRLEQADPDEPPGMGLDSLERLKVDVADTKAILISDAGDDLIQGKILHR
jgi:hypothetical protein